MDIYTSLYAFTLATPQQSSCTALFKANLFFIFSSFTLSVVVLCTRAYAVWENNKRILLLLTIAFIANEAAQGYTIYMVYRGISVIDLGIGKHPRIAGYCLLLVDRSLRHGYFNAFCLAVQISAACAVNEEAAPK